MNPILTWIGGATAALLLVFSGATLAGALIDGESTPEVEPVETADIALAIPIDPDAVAKSGEAKAPAASGAMLANADQDTADAADTAEKTPVPQAGGAVMTRASVSAAKRDEPLVVKRVLKIDGPIKYGEWHWNTDGVPPGRIVVTVDLDARVMSVFQGGYEIGAAAAMLGTPEHPTPIGTFPVLRKQRHNVSEKYNNAPMPWSVFLTRDGVAIHGGSEVENGYASHGCIAVPDEIAKRLFAKIKNGDKVIITRGETLGVGGTIL
ncbi:MAG: L,D-transpeptidase [Parerythrobacter sp.]